MSKAYLGGPAEDAAEAQWTEADQAYADFVSEIACEVSASEDDVYALLGALEERGLFSISEAAALVLKDDGPSQEPALPPQADAGALSRASED